MQQLSGLDTTFLNIESNACPMHVGGLVILEAPKKRVEDGGFGQFYRHVESRLDLIPPLRRRLIGSPLHLDHPYWIEDPDFDLIHHVKHRALPSPGNSRRLAELVCELTSQRLDRNLPLWEMNFVEGLESGQVAAISKMHHASIDGVSGAEIMGQMLDLKPTPRKIPAPAKPWQPDRVPSTFKLANMTTRSLARRPRDAWRVARDTWPVLLSSGREALERRRLARKGQKIQRQGMGLNAPRTRFNCQIGARRSYAFGSLSLDAVKQIKNRFGTSVNDVVMAICAAALRRYLLEKDELPDTSLVAGIPVSTRTDEQKGTAGNHVSFLSSPLFTDETDDEVRLLKISEQMAHAKDKMRALPASLMGDWAHLPAPALAALAARLYENFGAQDYHRPAFNVIISNVPGPSVPLYLGGLKVLANHPVSIPYHGNAFNITLMSYCGKLDFGLTAYHDCLPDIEHFAELMHEALEELLTLSEKAA